MCSLGKEPATSCSSVLHKLPPVTELHQATSHLQTARGTGGIMAQGEQKRCTACCISIAWDAKKQAPHLDCCLHSGERATKGTYGQSSTATLPPDMTCNACWRPFVSVARNFHESMLLKYAAMLLEPFKLRGRSWTHRAANCEKHSNNEALATAFPTALLTLSMAPSNCKSVSTVFNLGLDPSITQPTVLPWYEFGLRPLG